MGLIDIAGGRATMTMTVALLGTAASPLAAQEVKPPSTVTNERGIATVQQAIMALQRGDPTRSTPVRTLGNPGAFFGPAAYPPEALRAGEQGRSVARVEIDARGFPTGCAILSSSGSVSLDQATCRIATTRMQFSAARDEKGRPMAGQYTLPVRWILPGAALPKMVNMSMEAQITVGTDGAVEACADGEGQAAVGAGPCAMWPVGRKIIAPPIRDGRPVKAHIVISMDVATSLDP